MSVIFFGISFTALGTLASSGLSGGDQAYIYAGGAKRIMEFDASSTDATDESNHPYKRRPNDYSSAGVWVEQIAEGLPDVWNGSNIVTGVIESNNWIDGTSGTMLDLDNELIAIKNDTFGASGIQLGWISSAHKLYVGDGSNAFFQFDGTKITWKGANTELDASGNLTATSANITGELTATTGAIGGWAINSTTISKLTASAGISLDSSVPKITLTDGTYDRILLGKVDDVYAFQLKNSSGDLLFDISSDQSAPYLSNYADSKAIELELMKINFQNISWTQFAVFDAFDDETKRVAPDPSTNDALVERSQLIQGDNTVDKVFGFVSKTYTNITTIETGTSTSVGVNYLTDSAKSWFTNEVKNLTLKDSGANTFNVESSNATTLTISGTPDAGAYSLIDDNPAYAVAFCSLSDSSNGGYGTIKMEISFNGGINYQTFYETSVSDVRQGTVAIVNTGNDYIVRFTLTNDGSGEGPIIYKFLVCTDPSCWRF